MFPLRNRRLVERAQTGFPDMVYRHRAGFGKARRNPGSLRHFERKAVVGEVVPAPLQPFSVVLPGSAH
jgi:hypothetical protein